MASHQAPGLPQGGHAHFLQHRIDSLTVRGVKKDTKATSSVQDLLNMARALEGTFRSINNLLETLHHSEFFYFVAANWRFISIGLYMPALGLLLAPLILEALSQWLQARNPRLMLDGTSLQPLPAPTFPFSTVIILLLSCYGSGFLVYSSVLLGSRFSPPLDTSGLLTCLLVMPTLCVLILLLIRSHVLPQNWRMAKSMALIFFMLTLTALGMLNFSLAVMVSLILTPSTLLAQPFLQNRGHWVFHSCRLLLSLALCPPLALPLLYAAYLYFFLPSSTSLPSLLADGVSLSLHGTASALNSWHFHGCWLFPLMCMGVWPLWLMAWTLCTWREAAAIPPRDEPATKPHSD